MTLLRFDQAPRQAFIRGFVKGLAAPLSLYIGHQAPKELLEVEFQPLPARQRGDLRDDWKAVGQDIASAFEQQRARG
jgi:hypothetical protein